MLRTQSGIYSIKVALLAERGVIEYDPHTWDADKLISVGHTALTTRVFTSNNTLRKYLILVLMPPSSHPHVQMPLLFASMA